VANLEFGRFLSVMKRILLQVVVKRKKKSYIFIRILMFNMLLA